MTVEFQGVNTTIHVSIGEADRLLKAIGYPTTEETAGKMTIAKARKGLRRARFDVQDVELLRQLWNFSDLVDGLAFHGKKYVTWF